MSLCSNPLALFITNIRDMSTNYKKPFIDFIKLLVYWTWIVSDINWLHQLQVWYLFIPTTTTWKYNISSSICRWYYCCKQWSLGDSDIFKEIGWSILPQRFRTLKLLFGNGSNIYILISPPLTEKVYSRLIIKDKYAGCERSCHSSLY